MQLAETKSNRDTIKAMGFKKLNQTVEKNDNPAMRGMIKMIEHLVEVKEEA